MYCHGGTVTGVYVGSLVVCLSPPVSSRLSLVVCLSLSVFRCLSLIACRSLMYLVVCLSLSVSRCCLSLSVSRCLFIAVSLSLSVSRCLSLVVCLSLFRRPARRSYPRTPAGDQRRAYEVEGCGSARPSQSSRTEPFAKRPRARGARGSRKRAQWA